jgi:hypothetical protein
MGMFDWVRCEYPLPIKETNKVIYQTKSMLNNLDSFIIKEDGKLYHISFDDEGVVSDDTAKFYENFTGELLFYGHLDDATSSGWVEYSSYFIRGVLKIITVIEYKDKEGNTEINYVNNNLYTEEELREKFLTFVANSIKYWDDPSKGNTRFLLEGVCHTILAGINGNIPNMMPCRLIPFEDVATSSNLEKRCPLPEWGEDPIDIGSGLNTAIGKYFK